MTRSVVLLTVFMGLALAASAAEPFPKAAGETRGFSRHEFNVDGYGVRVIAPTNAAEGRPWVLLDSGDPRNVDLALLKQGFHVVTVSLPDPFGSPAAVAAWDAAYGEMTGTYGLSAKVVLEGYGLGGLIVYNWASAHPLSVACICVDSPVLDFKSWPGGKGKSEGDPALWQDLQKAHGFASEEEALAYRGNPVDTVKAVSEARIPVLHVYGRRDRVVPAKENTILLRKHYWEQGGSEFECIEKSGQETTPGLGAPDAIVHFVLRHTLYDGGKGPEPSPEDLAPWRVADFPGSAGVTLRDGVFFLERGNDMTGVTCPEPRFRMNYEISLKAMRVAGDDFFCGLTFPVGEEPCSLILGGWGGTIVGLSSLDYLDASENDTTRSIVFDKGCWYDIRLRVTDGRIQAWIDDESIIDVKTEGRNIGIRWEVEASVPLGIATWRTTGAFRDFRMAACSPSVSK
jgi:pimeloyl-ACP methyl ester carboxylesterase